MAQLHQNWLNIFLKNMCSRVIYTPRVLDAAGLREGLEICHFKVLFQVFLVESWIISCLLFWNRWLQTPKALFISKRCQYWIKSHLPHVCYARSLFISGIPGGWIWFTFSLVLAPGCMEKQTGWKAIFIFGDHIKNHRSKEKASFNTNKG